MPSWTPRHDGALELSPILQPLAPFQDHMLVFSGLDGLQGRGGTHTTAATRFLTGLIGKMTDQGIEAGPSIDQIAAQQFGQHTQLASLELSAGRLDLVGTCDNTTCAWINSLSWASATKQVSGEDNPRVVFERLFSRRPTSRGRVDRARAQDPCGMGIAPETPEVRQPQRSTGLASLTTERRFPAVSPGESAGHLRRARQGEGPAYPDAAGTMGDERHR